MRAAIPFALLLLALVVLLEVRHDERAVADGERAPVGLRAFSTGLGLPPEVPVRGNALSAVWVADSVFAEAPREDSLSAVVLDLGGGLVDTRVFPPDALGDEFVRWCRSRGRDRLLVLTARGQLEAAPDQRAGADALFAELGAATRPWDGPVSWILVARRHDDGWRRVGEAHSRRRGLSLALPLGREELDGLPVEGVLRFDAEGRAGHALLPALESGPLPAGVGVVRGVELTDGAFDALDVALPAGGTLTVPVPVSAADAPGVGRRRLRVSLAALALVAGPLPEVTFEVLVDGDVLAQSSVTASGLPWARWQPWVIDLPRELPDVLALRVMGAAPIRAFWGAPVIHADPAPAFVVPGWGGVTGAGAGAGAGIRTDAGGESGDDAGTGLGSAGAAGGLRALNGALRPASPDGAFRFLVGGHLYGHPERLGEGLASTFERALPALEQRGADFFVSLGDAFWQLQPPWSEQVPEAFARLSRPVYHALGNHEAAARETYEATFGPTYGAFVHGAALCVVLDTERDPWNIRGEQLAFLKAAVERAMGDEAIQHLLVFGHKVVFATLPGYGPLAAHLNAYDGWSGETNFRNEVLPLLAPLAAAKSVVWFAGDVGLPWSAPLFWHHHRGANTTFVATGVGDLARDLLLEVEVRPEGTLGWTIVPLGDAPEGDDVTAWGPERWRALFPEQDGDEQR